jgi:hypothetical protein
MTEDEFKYFVAEKAKLHWQSLTSPYLLASIPADFREATRTDYKSVLGDKKLKAFLEKTSGSDFYKVVQHPSQKAKVGLVPFDVSYDFPSEADDPSKEIKSTEPIVEIGVRDATLIFLEAISKLPEPEQERIVIPTKTIARLLLVR